MIRLAQLAHWSPRLFVLPLVAGLASCSQSPAAPTIESAVGAGGQVSSQQLPWLIQATVATTPAPPPAGCLAYFTSVIEGTATHLGRFTGTGSTCITDQVAPDPSPPFTPAGPGPYATAQFTNPRWTLVAANGDELWLEAPEAVGVFSLANMAFKAQGRQVIVGGTGRFDNATGEAQVGALNDGTQPADDFSGRGWIRFR